MTSKKILKSIMWTCLVLFLIPLGYLLVACVLSNITVERLASNSSNNQKIRLIGKGYSVLDDFYKAKGSYSLIKTCNTWVNSGFKYSGLRASLWTPFDFGLINQYQ